MYAHGTAYTAASKHPQAITTPHPPTHQASCPRGTRPPSKRFQVSCRNLGLDASMPRHGTAKLRDMPSAYILCSAVFSFTVSAEATPHAEATLQHGANYSVTGTLLLWFSGCQDWGDGAPTTGQTPRYGFQDVCSGTPGRIVVIETWLVSPSELSYWASKSFS